MNTDPRHHPGVGPVAALERILFGTGPLREAACRGHGDLFDPRNAEVAESHAEANERHQLAVAICQSCPALDACRVWADSEPDRGAVLAARLPYVPKRGRPASTTTTERISA